MNDNVTKLQILKKVANDGTIEVICDVLLDVLAKLEEKQKLGFTQKEEK